MFKQSLILSAFFIIALLADCPTQYPYSPQNGVFGGGSWQFWCSDWSLAQPGNGAVSFNATGNDLYVGLFDAPGTKVFKYALVIAGWSNTQIKLYENGVFSNELSTANFNVPSTDIPNSYIITFSKSAITVSFNGNIVFSYVDPHFTSQAGNAQYISLSQYGSNVALDRKSVV